MRLSKDGINLLMVAEGVRLKPYDDKTGKEISEYIPSATIGIGHLILKSEWNQYKTGIPADVAERLLKHDLTRFESAVNDNVKKQLNQNKFDALVMLAFNIGAGAFIKSSVLKLVNKSSAKTPYINLEQAWKAWNKSGGMIVNGLNNRRAMEWELYIMPEGI